MEQNFDKTFNYAVTNIVSLSRKFYLVAVTYHNSVPFSPSPISQWVKMTEHIEMGVGPLRPIQRDKAEEKK